ncbi:hypothetical protein [Microvirga arabica]|uniref:hypothetical protein n=1 Tax=Microvirga arabica TaxID=1128671 RepID=UPI00193A5342|nr:hypothetical protein [Microvirga arabica]MBM1174037.1 hypothetical protein [Microvirga arabica]
MVASMHQYEWELNESPGSNVQRIVRINLLHQGFLASDQFLRDWLNVNHRLLKRGLSITTLHFRRRFCEANHYQVQLPSKRWGPLVVIWGFPIPYVMESGKPKLLRILPRDWHLKQVGRSVRAPAFCVRKP